jgi:hypothetical protein
MTSSASPPNGNVVPLRTPNECGGGRAQAAQYVSQMTLELEKLANTAGLELVSYFLTLARIEAETYTRGPLTGSGSGSSQAPYHID